VAQTVLKAATSRTPKVRYPAGPLARRLSLLKKVRAGRVAGQRNSQSEQVDHSAETESGAAERPVVARNPPAQEWRSARKPGRSSWGAVTGVEQALELIQIAGRRRGQRLLD